MVGKFWKNNKHTVLNDRTNCVNDINVQLGKLKDKIMVSCYNNSYIKNKHAIIFNKYKYYVLGKKFKFASLLNFFNTKQD